MNIYQNKFQVLIYIHFKTYIFYVKKLKMYVEMQMLGEFLAAYKYMSRPGAIIEHAFWTM